jgi:hypothetical protein
MTELFVRELTQGIADSEIELLKWKRTARLGRGTGGLSRRNDCDQHVQ